MSDLAASLRYRYDVPALYGLAEVERPPAPWIRARALSQNIRVSAQVLPRVHRAVRGAAQALETALDVHAFVAADANVTASCTLDPATNRVTVFVSSRMVEVLDEREMTYVIGHELGHMLLGHWRYPRAQGEEDFRILELARASEISADRAGFVACGDRDVALSGMLKVASGLGREFLEIDVAEYVRQVHDQRSAEGDESILFATHPPFPIRARALLRFDRARRSGSEGGMQRIDEQIRREMDEVARGTGGNRFTELAKSAAFWEIAREAGRSGRLDADLQRRMEEAFGRPKLEALRDLLRGRSRPEVEALLEDKLVEARKRIDAAPLLAGTALREELDHFRKL